MSLQPAVTAVTLSPLLVLGLTATALFTFLLQVSGRIELGVMAVHIGIVLKCLQ